MIKKIIGILICLPLLMSMQCENSDDPIACTQEAKAGVNVTVSLGTQRSITNDGITVIATDGNYTETLQSFNVSDPIFSGAYERIGNYTITITKNGYKSYSSNVITVTRDVCHVIPQQLKVVLIPN